MAIEARKLRMRGKEGSLRLAEVRRRYSLVGDTQHDAMADAQATAELFLAQCHHMANISTLKISHLPLQCT
jgi:DNA polymerase-3 subunit epsilon